jgi:acylphosphatase
LLVDVHVYGWVLNKSDGSITTLIITSEKSSQFPCYFITMAH